MHSYFRYLLFPLLPTYFCRANFSLFSDRTSESSFSLSDTQGMNCSSSSDPDAVNATLLYNSADDVGNLWIRQSQDVPLPTCSSTAPPPDSQCTVCVDQVVYAVCRNLIDSMKLTMETVGHEIEISKSDCPRLLSDDAPQWLLPVVIILTLLVIAVIVVVYQCCKRSKYLRGTEIQTDEENEPSDL